MKPASEIYSAFRGRLKISFNLLYMHNFYINSYNITFIFPSKTNFNSSANMINLFYTRLTIKSLLHLGVDYTMVKTVLKEILLFLFGVGFILGVVLIDGQTTEDWRDTIFKSILTVFLIQLMLFIVKRKYKTTI
ncbi:hypothetical protein [Oceanobacillus iheyensis HTE831]|uniref:Uncharacterized protein n=2 Tax=Oceanobacillus iheyensis TaxID=182710 RepID=Q8ELA9_OCEIH|nr:hypothetical protein [Oceanobacillus iheyensis HTE831]